MKVTATNPSANRAARYVIVYTDRNNRRTLSKTLHTTQAAAQAALNRRPNLYKTNATDVSKRPVIITLTFEF